jgi:dTMP kinase
VKSCFIVFEGIDGSGKTTQARMLANHLTSKGVQVILTAEPSEGPVGSYIRSLTNRARPEEEARLFTEDRRDHLERTIIPALTKGFIVICDRYVYSSVAYQGSRGISPKSILADNRRFALPADVTFLIEIDVDLAMKRIGSGRSNTYTPLEIRSDLEKVDSIYKTLVDPCIIRISGANSQDEVHSQILQHLLNVGCVNAL